MSVTSVELVELAPRDGLQNEDAVLTTEAKVELVERAVRAGTKRIEVTSFVDPRRVPQLADADELMSALPRYDDVRYAGLVMNQRGLERALAGGVDEIDILVVATDTLCQRNQGMTTAEACATAAGLVAEAKAAGVFTTITVGASFGCPFEGEVPTPRLGEVLRQVVASGPDELALADTVGVAVPTEITERAALARKVAGPELPLRLHLHDTRNTAAANAMAALTAGITTLDTSIGGAGGCASAPAGTRNLATEDLLYLLDRMGWSTTLDLQETIANAAWLEKQLARSLPSSLLRAGPFP
ncbi:hydroxymethylglutaryl-CoA lyase [Kribbella sp. NPDC026611]|uniref:hydroxymethylglutaryl-CoA lyase n=1 Tax=Kribbella sp. NPDC026611 TaxID=3154911 RepID=UPI0033DE1BAC